MKNNAIVIHKIETDYPYLQVSNAMKNLSGEAFKLYTYLCSLGHGDMIVFSPAQISAETGISRSTVYRIFDKLIERGYLRFNENSQIYDFYTEKTEDAQSQNET